MPALRRVGELWKQGELDVAREQLATSITRRVLATVYRYILGSTESTRERVLLAGVEGDEHTLELEMVRDQLAAAGYQTILDTDLTADGLRAAVESQAPDVVVLGATVVAAAEAVKSVVHELRASHPDLPIVLGGAAVGGELPRERSGMRVLDSIEDSVEAVEDLLTDPPRVASMSHS